MKLPAAAYSAVVATSATTAGSSGIFGKGEYSQPGYFLCFFPAALAGRAFGFAFGFAFGRAFGFAFAFGLALGLALGLAFAFEMAGRAAAFAGARFARAGFTGAVFLP